jgi:hypothetical protein
MIWDAIWNPKMVDMVKGENAKKINRIKKDFLRDDNLLLKKILHRSKKLFIT